LLLVLVLKVITIIYLGGVIHGMAFHSSDFEHKHDGYSRSASYALN